MLQVCMYVRGFVLVCMSLCMSLCCVAPCCAVMCCVVAVLFFDCAGVGWARLTELHQTRLEQTVLVYMTVLS